ncbi:MAG: flagellar FlbD family protein [Planctomycetota bacterium]
MIKVTRLNGKEFVLNAEMILMVEATPDTVVTMRGGEKYVVKEGVEDVVLRAVMHGRALRTLPG